MILSIDIGNTNITLSMINKDLEVIKSSRIITKVSRTSHDFEVILEEFLGVEGVIISCVVPEVLSPLQSAILHCFGKEAVVIDHTSHSGIVIKTDHPEEVGADLIADAAAVYALYGGNTLVIDFGTATTFEYISEHGELSACVILPGLEISAKALSSMAAMLPDIELKFPESILATETITCMQAGIMYGYVGQVEYIIQQFAKELNCDDLKVALVDLFVVRVI